MRIWWLGRRRRCGGRVECFCDGWRSDGCLSPFFLSLSLSSGSAMFIHICYMYPHLHHSFHPYPLTHLLHLCDITNFETPSEPSPSRVSDTGSPLPAEDTSDPTNDSVTTQTTCSISNTTARPPVTSTPRRRRGVKHSDQSSATARGERAEISGEEERRGFRSHCQNSRDLVPRLVVVVFGKRRWRKGWGRLWDG